MVNARDWMQWADDVCWMLMRFFGCFLEKKKKSSRMLPLCLQGREEGNEGERRTFPRYSSMLNPALTSWLECACTKSTHLLGHTHHCLFLSHNSSSLHLWELFCTKTPVYVARLTTMTFWYIHMYTDLLCSHSVPVFFFFFFKRLSRVMRWKFSLRLNGEAFRVRNILSNFWCKIAANRTLQRMNKRSHKWRW